MPDVSKYFSDFFNGSAPADDYYIVFGLVGGLLLICWTACCIYFCIDFGNDNVSSYSEEYSIILLPLFPSINVHSANGSSWESIARGLRNIF